MADVQAAQQRLANAQDRAKRRAMGKPLTWTDAALDGLSAVNEADVATATALWDQAQQQERTGLDGLLGAEPADA